LQGYLYGEPRPTDEMTEFLHAAVGRDALGIATSVV